MDEQVFLVILSNSGGELDRRQVLGEDAIRDAVVDLIASITLMDGDTIRVQVVQQ